MELTSEGPGLVKTRPNWPCLIKLFDSELFARYAMCWARRYLPLNQAPLAAVEAQLREHIRTYHSTELWSEAAEAIRSHLRTCVEKAIKDHLPADYQAQAVDDLDREEFAGVLPPN